jgi:hypothetical protein
MARPQICHQILKTIKPLWRMPKVQVNKQQINLFYHPFGSEAFNKQVKIQPIKHNTSIVDILATQQPTSLFHKNDSNSTDGESMICKQLRFWKCRNVT